MKCSTTEALSRPFSQRSTSLALALRAFLLFIAIAFALSPSLYGQATGSFSGTVTDKSGSNIPEASITATSQATGLARTGKADETGHFVIPLLPVGLYTVQVSSAGFQTVESKGLNLDVNEA